jgi:hypothetical protein
MMPFDIDGYETHVRCNEMLARAAWDADKEGNAESAAFYRDILVARLAHRAKYERGESWRMRILLGFVLLAAAGYGISGVAHLLMLLR